MARIRSKGRALIAPEFLWLAGIVSPAFTMHILLNVPATGIAHAEGKNLKRYYESEQQADAYRHYRANTSIVVPLPNSVYAKLPSWIKRNLLLEWERFEYRPKQSSQHKKE